MFVKHSWSERNGKRYDSYHICKSYKDHDGVTRHEYLVNISDLPMEVIDKIKRVLQEEDHLRSLSDVTLNTGDACPGAGSLAVWRAYRKTSMDKALSCLTEAERDSAFAMILSRILNPCSKRAIKKELADNLFAKLFSKNRLDHDRLYQVMDRLEENFYDIQKKLRDRHHEQDQASLLLYDTTTTYFEGTSAEGGEYGKSKDHRWDRFQIIIGVITNRQGMPLAVETWDGNTQDRSTVNDRIDHLVEAFDVGQATFVSDEGTYSDVNIAHIKKNGFDYITSLQWHRQRELLEDMAPKQRKLFEQVGVYEWTEHIQPEDPDGQAQPHDVRYVGVFSKPRQARERKTRLDNMKKSRDLLVHLTETASKGAYYTPGRLREKINNRLGELNTSAFFDVRITQKDPDKHTDQKQLLEVDFRLCLDAIRKRRRREGKYILQTSLEEGEASSEDVDESYRRLQKVERGFREIKNMLGLRPVHHWKERRIKAHVLICFLSYFLTHYLKQEFRKAGIKQEVVPEIRRMDKLELVETTLSIDDESLTEYNWSLGEVGEKMKTRLQELGWWRSIQGYKGGLTKRLR